VRQQSGLRNDNRSAGLLAGLIVLVAIGILVAIWLDRGSKSDQVNAGDVSTTETTAGDAPATSLDPVVLPTVPVIPTAVEASPTSVFIPQGGAAAPAADADTTGGAVQSGFDDSDGEDPEATFEDDGAQSFPTPTPEPTVASSRTGDPFEFAGDASWWEPDLIEGGATIATNELEFVINEDGTGSIRGAFEASWADGRAWSIMLDEDFTYDTTTSNVRATISAGTVTMDGEAQNVGTMAIRDPGDGFGALCFGTACPSFQYEVPFWAQRPEA